MTLPLIFGFSRAADGTMAIDGGWDNRLRYLQEQGISSGQVVHAGLCHGATTAVVTVADGGLVVPKTDGLITTESGLALAMTAADCLLLTVSDSSSTSIGLLHAGRRGLAAGVIPNFFAVWFRETPAHAVTTRVMISPSICQQHYPVSRADAAAFTAWPDACRAERDSVCLDLRRVALAQLQSAGIQPGMVTVSPDCTFEQPKYFSYRRDHPTTPQLQVGFVFRTVT